MSSPITPAGVVSVVTNPILTLSAWATPVMLIALAIKTVRIILINIVLSCDFSC
jgi:hypothetical protein